jgi:hypothetical protein
MTEKIQDVKVEEKADTVSKLFEERDQERQPKTERITQEKTSANPMIEKEREPDVIHAHDLKPAEQKSDLLVKNLKEAGDEVEPPSDQASLSQAGLSEIEVLRKKLEKTEKVLAENHKYGRSNAQKLKNAVKAVQKFADDGLLAEEEAKELYQALHAEGEEPEEDGASYQATSSQTSLFAPIFKVANKELENILKYTDDEHLQDKVNAFDYFLSVGSKEEIEKVLEDLSDLLDNPLKLARKMLSIGQEVYEESYKGIKEAGGFKNYLSKKEEEVEKLRKKVDKLEKKLLQYEDFDKPRYRMDETGSPGTGNVEGGKPANDTISALFDERDKAGGNRKA